MCPTTSYHRYLKLRPGIFLPHQHQRSTQPLGKKPATCSNPLTLQQAGHSARLAAEAESLSPAQRRCVRSLQEAMRVRPVAATGSTRYTKRDMVVGGHFLPKGSMVDVPFYAVSSLPGRIPYASSPARLSITKASVQ